MTPMSQTTWLVKPRRTGWPQPSTVSVQVEALSSMSCLRQVLLLASDVASSPLVDKTADRSFNEKSMLATPQNVATASYKDRSNPTKL